VRRENVSDVERIRQWSCPERSEDYVAHAGQVRYHGFFAGRSRFRGLYSDGVPLTPAAALSRHAPRASARSRPRHPVPAGLDRAAPAVSAVREPRAPGTGRGGEADAAGAALLEPSGTVLRTGAFSRLGARLPGAGRERGVHS